MTDLLRVVLVLVAAVNPPRLAGVTQGLGRRVTAVGSAVAGVVLVGVALLSGPLLDGLDITAPTARIATGIVAAGAGLWHLVGPMPQPWSASDEVPAALVPVAFPVLLRPEVVLVGLSSGADEGVVVTAIGAAVALTSAVWALSERVPVAGRAGRPAARLVGALLVLLGVDMVIDGIFDV